LSAAVSFFSAQLSGTCLMQTQIFKAVTPIDSGLSQAEPVWLVRR
jgi:hypothetical protein